MKRSRMWDASIWLNWLVQYPRGAALKLFIYTISVCLILTKSSFTLYPVYSRVGKGNLVVRHSVVQFLSKFQRDTVSL